MKRGSSRAECASLGVNSGFLGGLGRWLPVRHLYLVLYDFRHTFASRFVMGGGDTFTLKRILGHSGTRVLERYVHISRDHERAEMIKFEQKFGNIAGLSEIQ